MPKYFVRIGLHGREKLSVISYQLLVVSHKFHDVLDTYNPAVKYYCQPSL